MEYYVGLDVSLKRTSGPARIGLENLTSKPGIREQHRSKSVIQRIPSMDDPTPLLGIVANSVASFSIGFAKLRVIGKQEDATLAGSGALVTVGPIRGILTAAHVLEELPDRGQVGLIRFTTNPVLQKQSIDMYLTDRLTIGGEHNGADGPDIGFLRLASHQAAALDATNVFFNLSKREESVLADNHPSAKSFAGVCGVIDKWTTEEPAGGSGFDRLKAFRGLFGVGVVAGTRESGGYDLIDFLTTYEENSKAPYSYKGMSGGALWRVYVTTASDGQPSVLDKRIFGVAFHESDLVDGKRTVWCHGPKSVYGVLVQEIRKKWPMA